MIGITRTISAAAALLAATAAHAQTVPITPDNSQISYTVYALGLLPVAGRFQHFAGAITWRPTPDHPCQVDIEVQVASLQMTDPDRQRDALSAAMLNAAAHPTMHFTGDCQGSLIAGRLTLHGVTRPFAVTWHQTQKQIVGIGALRRTDYGVNGMPMLVSSMVHIMFSIGLPAQ